VEIDRQLEALRTQPPAKREIVEHAPGATSTRRHHDLVQMWIASDHRRRRGLDDIGEMRVRKPPPQRLDGRRCENNITDLAEPNQKNS
jgi:hypothetical protein